MLSVSLATAVTFIATNLADLRVIAFRVMGGRVEGEGQTVAQAGQASYDHSAKEVELTDDAAKPWPTELRLHKNRKTLTIAFDNGERFELSAEYLRVKSPSAEVQGHSPDERKTVAGKRNVAILEVHPIGNYAVRLVFDDLHSTGIYSWDYFLGLGRNRDANWQDYLDDLSGKGLSR
jgi:DUF971 family protein